MCRFRHFFFWSAVSLMILLVNSCRRETSGDEPQIMVSLYIPGTTMTRAETGMVSPLQEELKITSLQIWVFLEDGTPVSYGSFGADLLRTGLPNSTITRFGLSLTPEKFALLTATNPRPKVDVYALANAASAVNIVPGQNATRDELDNKVLEKFNGTYLTMSVPSNGLPMSGVLKGTDVSGDYPVLNVTKDNALKLTRAVSKIRFVFCQQGVPATDETPADIANDQCAIVGVRFDGTSGGKDCQIGETERLFTTKSFDLGDEPGYSALNASVTGSPLIPNSKLSVVMDPEELIFRGPGNESETAEHYESRLDAAISRESQIGPIYLRETDKTISGTITYRTSDDGSVQTVNFEMETGGFPRNHTWIVYACFVEETMKLRLKVVVLPWEWSSYNVNYKTGMVNVIRRFSVMETSVPTFTKVQTSDGFYDVSFWHHVQLEESIQENVLHGDIIISTPVGGRLHCIPVPGKDDGTALTDAFIVTPKPTDSEAVIYPNYMNMESGRIEDCRIPIQIKCNTAAGTDDELEGNYIDLHFSVETPDGRFVDLGSESIDYYRFILKKRWDQ